MGKFWRYLQTIRALTGLNLGIILQSFMKMFFVFMSWYLNHIQPFSPENTHKNHDTIKVYHFSSGSYNSTIIFGYCWQVGRKIFQSRKCVTNPHNCNKVGFTDVIPQIHQYIIWFIVIYTIIDLKQQSCGCWLQFPRIIC